MSKVCDIDTKDLDNILDNLNEDNRNKALFTSIIKGGQELVKETKQELKRVLPKANSQMVSGVKLKKDKSYQEVTVHIMGDYRLKWFEMGTEERYLRKPLPRKEDTRYKYKSGSTNTGGLPYRGKINKLEFFKTARENSQMTGKVIETLIKEIDKLLK